MRERVERDVWLPVTHPVSGKRVNVRAMATDRLVTPAEIEQLEAIVNGDPGNDQTEERDHG